MTPGDATPIDYSRSEADLTQKPSGDDVMHFWKRWKKRKASKRHIELERLMANSIDHRNIYVTAMSRGISLLMLSNGGGLATCVSALSAGHKEPVVVNVLVGFMWCYLAGISAGAFGYVALIYWTVSLENFIKVKDQDLGRHRGETLKEWSSACHALNWLSLFIAVSLACFFFGTAFGLQKIANTLGG